MSSSKKDELTAFINRIDEYLSGKNIQSLDIPPEALYAESIPYTEMVKLTTDDCFNYAHMLYQLAIVINQEKEKQKIALNWCNDALLDIIAGESGNYSPYTRHDVKMAMIIRENSVAQKIHEWKQVAEARFTMLENREFLIRRQAECLIDKGKRK